MPDALGLIAPAAAAANAAGSAVEAEGAVSGMVLSLVGALILMLVALAALLVVLVADGPRRRLRRRMTAIGLVDGPPAGAGGGARLARAGARGGSQAARQKRIQEKLQELEGKSTGKAQRRNQLRADLVQAGLDWDVRKYTGVMMGSGVAITMAFMLVLGNVLLALAAGVVGAFGVPRLILRWKAARRRKAFVREFPNAIDVLVRGMRSGLPVGECMGIVARESPEPLSGEFKHLVDGMRLGMSMEEVMHRATERLPVPEYRFFAIVLQIQQQTGGNLAETLSNLSTVLRDRKKLRDKVKAMSSEAKASAAIIGSLPFIVGGIVYLVNADYIMLLFTEFAGNVIVGGGVAWMLLGIAIMAKMINFRM
ncbi:type II secretion system F family protein [Caenispirillum salinarum]|uniref:type II secretion system F family protein n=1 Tax=Caenispirillum salinarum TaxID=859058 RepID=UPI00384BC744